MFPWIYAVTPSGIRLATTSESALFWSFERPELNGEVRAIAASERWLAWLVFEQDVSSLKVADPANAPEPRTFTLPAEARSLPVMGDFAYVGTRSGLFAVDIGQP